jgi:CheY-like chemotaxis protein
MARILIAEDNSLVRWTLAMLMQSQGHDVDLAADGQQALCHFAAHPADIVVLDVHMPGMDGLEVCQRLRRGSAVPILMLSTLDYALVREQALGYGADAFLLKPLEIDDLLRWVRTLCEAGIQPSQDSGRPGSAAPWRSVASRQGRPPAGSRKQQGGSTPAQASGLATKTGIPPRGKPRADYRSRASSRFGGEQAGPLCDARRRGSRPSFLRECVHAAETARNSSF